MKQQDAYITLKQKFETLENTYYTVSHSMDGIVDRQVFGFSEEEKEAIFSDLYFECPHPIGKHMMQILKDTYEDNPEILHEFILNKATIWRPLSADTQSYIVCVYFAFAGFVIKVDLPADDYVTIIDGNVIIDKPKAVKDFIPTLVLWFNDTNLPKQRNNP